MRTFFVAVGLTGAVLAAAWAVSPLDVTQGGTGTNAVPSSGQMAVGNGAEYSVQTIGGDVSMGPSGAMTVITIGGVSLPSAIATAIAAIPAPCTTGSKLFCGTATTNSAGLFTATITPACGSAPTFISITAKAPGTNLANQTNASYTGSTTSTVSGLITTPATLSILGLTVIAPPTGTVVSVTGVCP